MGPNHTRIAFTHHAMRRYRRRSKDRQLDKTQLARQGRIVTKRPTYLYTWLLDDQPDANAVAYLLVQDVVFILAATDELDHQSDYVAVTCMRRQERHQARGHAARDRRAILRAERDYEIEMREGRAA